MVMAQTLFKQLKQIEPNAQIDVLAPDWTKALLNRMPEVHRAVSAPLKHGELNLKKRWRIARELKKENRSTNTCKNAAKTDKAKKTLSVWTPRYVFCGSADCPY